MSSAYGNMSIARFLCDHCYAVNDSGHSEGHRISLIWSHLMGKLSERRNHTIRFRFMRIIRWFLLILLSSENRNSFTGNAFIKGAHPQRTPPMRMKIKEEICKFSPIFSVATPSLLPLSGRMVYAKVCYGKTIHATRRVSHICQSHFLIFMRL